MGSVALPTTGLVYVDANVVIYTVEKHPKYSPVLRPLWSAVAAGQARVFVSELILLETLVGPYRANDPQLADDYEMFLRLPGLELVAVSPAILRGGSTAFATAATAISRRDSRGDGLEPWCHQSGHQ